MYTHFITLLYLSHLRQQEGFIQIFALTFFKLNYYTVNDFCFTNHSFLPNNILSVSYWVNQARAKYLMFKEFKNMAHSNG